MFGKEGINKYPRLTHGSRRKRAEAKTSNSDTANTGNSATCRCRSCHAINCASVDGACVIFPAVSIEDAPVCKLEACESETAFESILDKSPESTPRSTPYLGDGPGRGEFAFDWMRELACEARWNMTSERRRGAYDERNVPFGGA